MTETSSPPSSGGALFRSLLSQRAGAASLADAVAASGDPVTIEYSSTSCNVVDGWRSRDHGDAGWQPGRVIAIRLPAVAAAVRLDAIEYAFQWNAGGSAPLGLAHRSWLFVAPAGAPPADGPIATWDVPANPSVDDADQHTIRLDVPAPARPAVGPGDAIFVAIDVTPPGVDFDSLDVDQCWVADDPVGDFVWYAPTTAPPFAWTAEPQFFSSYVPNVRGFGVAVQ